MVFFLLLEKTRPGFKLRPLCFSLLAPSSFRRLLSPMARVTKEREFLFSSESVNEGHPDKLCAPASPLGVNCGSCYAAELTPENILLIFSIVTTPF